jgi:hypothetical protein
MRMGLTAIRFKAWAISALLMLVCPAVAEAASHKFIPCKPVRNQCVGIIDVYNDGVYWIANRVVKDGRETWEPIKRAHCPTDEDYHGRRAYARDPKYGDYMCVYDDIRERPDPSTKPGKLFRYITTHKVLLASDATLALSSLADAASAAHCQHVSPFCHETNPLLGPHPSTAALYGTKMGLTAMYIGIDHWWEHEFKGTAPEKIYVFWSAWLVSQSYGGTLSNISTALSYRGPSPALSANDLVGAGGRLTIAHEQLMRAVPIP